MGEVSHLASLCCDPGNIFSRIVPRKLQMSFQPGALRSMVSIHACGYVWMDSTRRTNNICYSYEVHVPKRPPGAGQGLAGVVGCACMLGCATLTTNVSRRRGNPGEATCSCL